MPRLEALEDVMEDAGPARLGEELGAEPDQAAGGNDDVHPHPARSMVDERLGPSLAKGEQLRDDAEVVLRHIDRDALHRLVHLTLDDAGHDLRLSDRQLESLASHLLDQHGELQLAATLHLPHLGPLGRENAQRDVSDELGLKAVLDLACGQLVAVSAGERSRVDADGHRERWFVDGDHGQRPRIERVREGLADHHFGDAGDGDQVARPRLLGLDAVERLADEQLGRLRARDRPVGAAPRKLLAAANRPLLHATEREAADVGRGVEVRDESLQRVAILVDRRRDVLEDQLEQRREVGPESVRVGLERGTTRLRVAVDDRKLDLALVRVEVEKKRVDLVDDVGDSRIGAVDLVDDENDGKSRLERLAEHEARLRQRALARVDEEQDAVDHRQSALHLTAEVGMARRIDDVDLDGTVPDCGVLGQDRDPLLAFELPGIEDLLGDGLVLAEGARLPEQRIDEGRLPVIDVGDDGDVTDVGALRHLPRVPGAATRPLRPRLL